MFPRLRKRSSLRSVDAEDVSTGRATDYVFRIIYPGHRHEHSECLKPLSGGREGGSGWWGVQCHLGPGWGTAGRARCPGQGDPGRLSLSLAWDLSAHKPSL